MAELREAQSLAVKRAQVEFHNFASFGEPERVLAAYREENLRRAAIFDKHREFIGNLSPFLEIGANAGHTSYYLINELGARGFALDISADSLRHGQALQDHWGYAHAPVRVAGDALHLPFRDGSLRMVMAFQMLSQFMDIEKVFLEVKRVLAPGGVFVFAEEPVRRLLTLRLYRAPYYQNMKPWERRLSDLGLLGFLVRDVIGAHQEESFGIRQNHRMWLGDWHHLVRKHFVDYRYEVFVPRRGSLETWVANTARRFDKLGCDWTGGKLLGGTLAAIARKEGAGAVEPYREDEFARCLQCPDCGGELRRDASETLRCGACTYTAAHEGGVYNLLPSADRNELYPGDRDDIADFSLPSHSGRLRDGWFELEGVFGNKYRWMAERAEAVLRRVRPGAQRLRIRGFASEAFLAQPAPARVKVVVNGNAVIEQTLDRTGVFVLEADLPEAAEYRIEIHASPAWIPPEDDRALTVNVSMIRLVPRET
jgi:ubiquinone/menaquinone biosynthesis C-methylase UbiE